jgi:hypothetical protein
MKPEQLSLSIIPHDYDGTMIHQRAVDGYVNATAMCKAVGKQFNDYSRNASTKEFLQELSRSTGIPVDQLVYINSIGKNNERGTWVHPDIAVNLGQWCSPKFAVAVSQWVREWISGKFTSAKLPYHLQRYMANRSEIPHTHWSMLNEMTFALIAPLEDAGYTLPDHMLPDISEGQMFSSFLRNQGIDTAKMLKYRHTYQDTRIVFPRLYPNSVLALFREHFNEVWLPKKAIAYFEERDPKALPFLQKLLSSVQFKQLTD